MSLIIPEIFNDTTYQIEVISMKAKDHLGMPNVVYSLSYRLKTFYQDTVFENEHTETYDLESIESVDDLAPFNSLTEETIKGWIEGTEHFIYLRYSQCQQIMDSIEDDTVDLPWQ